mmetsp:Transcript_147/g.162  ORF Transcript_147/g.162 Transcript_147/m.162 type:complete len:120 (+) Transcript_147:83-442(+)|eukprot:CAMPEP_0114356810 /NCGR_PEP_ID=MMETSP0101-20121206/21209_1 /TAXON_ID=38822 ORGANISM="Pteridomonas danica, Strain PT" /NCGR_SAMPLE_ID=MMETSP0101 /ASSEMBLY_ACC=CAM_ASM_000211 /LENGTH=119 /DNA_ID=CAMNT_0001499365 /DNA_START=84 /DNA_END=443 /DNA_ORIENTATION=-
MSSEEDEYGFDREQLEPIVKQAIDDTLLKETYDESRTEMLTDLICERVLGGIGALSLPMKFVVSCIIMQNNGAGLNSEIAMHCDTRSDDFMVIKWPDKKLKEAATCHMFCVVTVGAVLF